MKREQLELRLLVTTMILLIVALIAIQGVVKTILIFIIGFILIGLYHIVSKFILNRYSKD